MSGGKIGYRIMAVRERSKIVDSIVKSLNPHEPIVFFDDAHNGCAWNAIRAWQSAEDSDYICVLQDDIELVNGFCDIANIVAMLFPDSIISFYNQDLELSDFEGAIYGILPTCAISGPAIMMPKAIAKRFVQFFNANFDSGYNYDDAAIRMFALLNGIQVVTMCPSLVRCIDDVKSTFGNSHSKKNTLVWQGRNVNIEMFKRQSVRTLKPVSIRTHLPKDHFLRLEVERKVRIIKKVYV